MNKIRIFDSLQNEIKEVDKVLKTNVEWKRILSPEQYRVTSEKGTEQPFTCTFANIKEKGVFQCIRCGTDLFRSVAKFDSGTGWRRNENRHQSGRLRHPDSQRLKSGSNPRKLRSEKKEKSSGSHDQSDPEVNRIPRSKTKTRDRRKDPVDQTRYRKHKSILCPAENRVQIS